MTAIAELQAIAAKAPRPSDKHTIALVVEGTTGGRLAGGGFSGIGGTTLYGPAWFDGLRKSRPIHLFEQAQDARALADILEGREPALRSASHSVAGLPVGSAERDAVPSAVAHDSRSSSRTEPRPLAGRLDGVATTDSTVAVERAAGSPGASLDTHEGPGIKPSGVAATRSTDAPAVVSSDGGAAGSASGMASASPGPTPFPGASLVPGDVAPGDPRYYGPPLCVACGRDLSTLPPSTMTGRRKTCSDACRQAYHRGHRAPLPGVVDATTLDRLSRLPGRLTKVVVRFWGKVDRTGGADACWPWTGFKNDEGYGAANAGDGKVERAHRIAYQLTRGVIAEGMRICHRCDNPPCCNPRHLFEGTDADNVHDSMAKGRFLANRQPAGHGDPDRAPDPDQLAIPLSAERMPAAKRRGRARPSAPVASPS